MLNLVEPTSRNPFQRGWPELTGRGKKFLLLAGVIKLLPRTLLIIAISNTFVPTSGCLFSLRLADFGNIHDAMADPSSVA
jgi:hypothetical protein